MKTLHSIILVSWLGVVSLTTSAWASPKNLDDATLIDNLAKYGMTDLLDRFSEVNTSVDPVTTQQIQIARHRIDFRAPQRSTHEQADAYQLMIDAMRTLISQHHDHEQRPLWQTDLAESLLFELLQERKRNAADFYEFGQPTADQRKAFESTVVEALEQLMDADVRFFLLQTELPRDPDHDEKRVDTGLWDRMINEYYKTKTQFLLAHAAHYAAMLQDDHPYFQKLGQNPKVPRQASNPGRERDRLRQLTIDRLASLINDRDDRYGLRLSAYGLTGRAMSRLPSGANQATQPLDQVLNEDRGDFNDLLAGLAKAVVMDLQGRHRPAVDQLLRLNDHAMVQQYPYYRLLIFDQIHRLKIDQAMSLSDPDRETAIVAAYQPYEDLLSDRALDRGVIAEFKRHIYSRWREALGQNGDLNDLPALVIRGIGEISSQEGQNLSLEAQRLLDEGQDQLAQELLDQAKPKLEHAIQINTDLLQRQDLTAPTRADAMYNLGLSQYFLAKGEDLGLQITAAKVWTDLAEQLPDQPVAKDAITNSVSVLRQFYDLAPQPEGVADAYEHAGQVLFEHFGTSPMADDERHYYAFHVLTQRGRYAEAVDVLNKVPPDHSSYFEARREMLLNLKSLFEESDKPIDRQSTRDQLVGAAEDLIRETQGRWDESPSIQQAAGWARLALVDVAIAESNTEEALQRLDGFESDFQPLPMLVGEALARGIMALAQVGQFEKAVNQARQMMDLFPDDAAAVIDGVLENLDQRVDLLRKQAQETQVDSQKNKLEGEAKQVAHTAEQLARLLRDWAQKQGLSEDELLPYDMILAKAIRFAGKPDGAIALLTPIYEKNPLDPDVMHQLAESLFVSGDRDSLIKAGNQFYDKLIVGLEGQQDPYLRRLWWNAWMRRLQISDLLKEGTETIALRVRQLELTDDSLGGEPFHSELKRLEVKHSMFAPGQ